MATLQMDWARVEVVFAQVVDLSEPARTEVLAQCCGDDDALKREVSSLLASAEGAAHCIEQVVAAETALVGETRGLIGEAIGPYRVLGLLGEGGMGAVYLAERADQFEMRVAIKVVHRGLGGPELRVRFRDERQILATLDHPSIVRILDGSETPEGQPYLVMEYVEGVPLLAFVRDVPLRGRLELVLKICAALEYAHSKLVVHRDIKPSNILVSPAGMPKLLDFGIAKMLEAPTSDQRRRTLTGLAPMTPEYASPEQARGERVTVATDVYSLGALLFELLVGRPPQELKVDAFEMLRAICEVDAPRPSTVAAAPLRAELSKDLDSIVLRALQKHPSDRYPSVTAFREDLERLLSGHAVLAHDATPGYRLHKYLGRHRVALTLAALVSLVLSASTAMSVREARRADRHAQQAERQTRILLAEQGAQQLENGHHGQALAYLVEALRAGEDTPAVRFQVAEAMRPFEQVIATLRENTSGVAHLAWSSTGERLAVTECNGTVWVYDAEGHVVQKLTGGPQVPYATFIKQDTKLVVRGWEGARAWDLASGALEFSTDFPWASGNWIVPGNEVAPTVLGDRLAIAGLGEVRVWDLATKRLVLQHREPSHDIPCFALANEGRRLFVGNDQGVIQAIDLETGQKVFELRGHAGRIRTLGLSGDGTRLYSLGIDKTFRVWNLETRTEFATLTGASLYQPEQHAPRIVSVAMPWGVRLLDLQTGQVTAERVVTSKGSGDWGVEVDPEANTLLWWSPNHYSMFELSTELDGLKFELAPTAGNAPHSATGTLAARLSPDGTRFAAASGTEVELRHLNWAPRLARFDLNEAAGGRFVYAAVASRGQGRIVTTGNDPDRRSNVHLFERDAGAEWHEVSRFANGESTLWDVSFSPDERRVVVARDDGTAAIYTLEGARSVMLTGHRAAVNRAQFAPDGQTVVTASDDFSARIWSAATGVVERTLTHPDRVLAAAWSPTGDRLVTAGWDGVVRLWNPATGEVLQALARPGVQFLDATFSPDGQRVVASTHGGEVFAWRLSAPDHPILLTGNLGPVPTVVYSPDGRIIATAAYSGSVRLFDADDGRLIGSRETGSAILQASFTADGRALLVASAKGAFLFDVHRDERSVAALDAYLAEHVPWRLVNGQLELVRLGSHAP